MKRFAVAFAALLALASPALPAGTISFSLSQQLNTLGKPLANCNLYFYQAGTVATPQNAYKDTGLTLAHPNPLRCDAAGRLPQFYLADGQIKVRLTDANGIPQVEADNLLVIGPSSGGGGGGGGVDATTVFQTGDVLWVDAQGTRAGWVRDNGRTIGSATSGATERANADTQQLYVKLWGRPDCPISGGAGVSAAADFAANKTLQLPDKRGYIAGGVDDMGNSAASRFTGVPVATGDVLTAGSIVGETIHALTQSELPNASFAVTIPSGQGSHKHVYSKATAAYGAAGGGTGVAVTIADADTTTSTLPGMTGTAASGGSGTAHNNVQKTVLGTFYRKL